MRDSWCLFGRFLCDINVTM
uniref:Uncharacterized protein n=1 Tax=Anopheles funestus TaxID=62324 RepID=A0A4Y0BE96_ANOFN